MFEVLVRESDDAPWLVPRSERRWAVLFEDEVIIGEPPARVAEPDVLRARARLEHVPRLQQVVRRVDHLAIDEHVLVSDGLTERRREEGVRGVSR